MLFEFSKDLFKILLFFIFMRKNVSDLNIFNLLDDIVIYYDIILYIIVLEFEDEIYYDKIVQILDKLLFCVVLVCIFFCIIFFFL